MPPNRTFAKVKLVQGASSRATGKTKFSGRSVNISEPTKKTTSFIKTGQEASLLEIYKLLGAHYS